MAAKKPPRAANFGHGIWGDVNDAEHMREAQRLAEVAEERSTRYLLKYERIDRALHIGGHVFFGIVFCALLVLTIVSLASKSSSPLYGGGLPLFFAMIVWLMIWLGMMGRS